MMRITMVALLATSCSGGEERATPDAAALVDAVSSGIRENVLFEQLVDEFDDRATCEAMTQGSGFNCVRSLTLCTNSGFLLIVTDIVNEGRYVETPSGLVAQLEGPGDGPPRFTVRLVGDGLESAELGGRHPWSRVAGASTAALAESCLAMEGRTWW